MSGRYDYTDYADHHMIPREPENDNQQDPTEDAE